MEIIQVEIPHIPSWANVFQPISVAPAEEVMEDVSSGFMSFITKYWLLLLIGGSIAAGLLYVFVFSKKKTPPNDDDEMQRYLSTIKT
jgi:hypothetical protein